MRAVCLSCAIAALTCLGLADASSGVALATRRGSVVGQGSSHPLGHGRPGPLRADGRYLIDPEGRVVILHGLFAVWKQQPLFPSGIDSTSDPSLPSFTDGDADEVRTLGFDGARVSWYWEGLEPTQGNYSSTYLNGIAGAVGRLSSRGVYVVLDAHQDQYDQLFGNEPGFPKWSAVSDGQPLAPAPLDPGYVGWKFPLGYFHTSTELRSATCTPTSASAGRASERPSPAPGRSWLSASYTTRCSPAMT